MVDGCSRCCGSIAPDRRRQRELSDDEGQSWKWKRHLEFSEPGRNATHGAYPSIIQAKDGTLHASYTYTLNGKNVKKDASGRPERECIKHAHFDVAWIKSENASATPK